MIAPQIELTPIEGAPGLVEFVNRNHFSERVKVILLLVTSTLITEPMSPLTQHLYNGQIDFPITSNDFIHHVVQETEKEHRVVRDIAFCTMYPRGTGEIWSRHYITKDLLNTLNPTVLLTDVKENSYYYPGQFNDRFIAARCLLQGIENKLIIAAWTNKQEVLVENGFQGALPKLLKYKTLLKRHILP